jgi:transcriptional regulator
MTAVRATLVPGTLEMLVLKTLSLEPAHGWRICARIQQLSNGVFSVNQGSLYPALERLQQRGWSTSEWRVTDSKRRARYYKVTKAGQKQLAAEQEAWQVAARAIDLILSTV